MTSSLYYGDNLKVLREHVRTESVDLVYLDPPFNSKRNYNVLFRDAGDHESEAQVHAFEDCWHWDASAQKTYAELTGRGAVPRVAQYLEAMHGFLGINDMFAYLVMMAPRLIELRRVLKPTGSIYLHCDQTANHYLKLLMDAIFGADNFLNNVVWLYGLGGSSSRYWPRKHDDLLWYSKTPDAHFFNADRVPATSARMAGMDKKAPDYWDIPALNNMAKERLGYPTQKPEALLERIIKSTSRAGDVVLDPFCGCGTTVSVAERLERRWIGIDITHLAVSLIRRRLEGNAPNARYEVLGEPVDLDGARALAESDQYQFQWWALDRIGARPSGDVAGRIGKRGADRGVDGVIRFRDDWKAEKSHTIVVSVKAGHNLNPSMVRDLRGVMEREGAPIAVLLTMHEPTREMRTEAASAGFWESQTFNPGRKYQRLQILTMADVFAGRGADYPGEDRTHRSSPPMPAPMENLLLPGMDGRIGLAKAAPPLRAAASAPMKRRQKKG